MVDIHIVRTIVSHLPALSLLGPSLGSVRLWRSSFAFKLGWFFLVSFLQQEKTCFLTVTGPGLLGKIIYVLLKKERASQLFSPASTHREWSCLHSTRIS